MIEMATWDPIDKVIKDLSPPAKPVIQPRAVSARGTPILDGDDPRVRRVAQLMATTLKSMVELDVDSVCATDVLYMLMRDSLWVRDNYHGASNPNISPEEREARLTKAISHVLDAKRFNDYSSRYIDHCDNIGEHKKT